ncbi:hypothetical protein GE09DRAFT_361557 [Coniochaeta sp. 2T2.1]|nr:hypothetical protein GE09DRAFT_361557 [Coniochaeta sp. 2T2.1]
MASTVSQKLLKTFWQAFAMRAPLTRPPTISDGDIRRVVIGPLTTTFTPPPECSMCVEDASMKYSYSNDCVAYFRDCTSKRLACLPVNGDQDIIPRGFYSPGLQCPSGWITAMVVDRGHADMEVFYSTLLPDETAALCCPSEFPAAAWDTTRGFEFSILNAPAYCYADVLVYSKCDHFGSLAEATHSASSSGLGPGVAPAIQINWRPRDLGWVSALSTTAGPGGPLSTSVWPTALLPAADGTSRQELVGIVTGTILATALACAGVWWFMTRRLRRRAQRADELIAFADDGPLRPPLPLRHGNKPELDATVASPRFELPSPCSSDGPNTTASRLRSTDWALISPTASQIGAETQERTGDTVERIESIQHLENRQEDRQ